MVTKTSQWSVKKYLRFQQPLHLRSADDSSQPQSQLETPHSGWTGVEKNDLKVVIEEISTRSSGASSTSSSLSSSSAGDVLLLSVSLKVLSCPNNGEKEDVLEKLQLTSPAVSAVQKGPLLAIKAKLGDTFKRFQLRFHSDSDAEECFGLIRSFAAPSDFPSETQGSLQQQTPRRDKPRSVKQWRACGTPNTGNIHADQSPLVAATSKKRKSLPTETAAAAENSAPNAASGVGSFLDLCEAEQRDAIRRVFHDPHFPAFLLKVDSLLKLQQNRSK